MAKFIYLGDVDPNNFATEVFGVRFLVGEPKEVTEERAVSKLRANPRFQIVVEDAEVVAEVEDAPKRRGRPAKPRDVIEAEPDGDQV